MILLQRAPKLSDQFSLYAILILFMATGMRRSEVISLCGRDIRVEEMLVLTSIVKGGSYIGREVSDSSVKEALIDYFSTAKRLHVLKTDASVWTRHDRGGRYWLGHSNTRCVRS